MKQGIAENDVLRFYICVYECKKEFINNLELVDL